MLPRPHCIGVDIFKFRLSSAYLRSLLHTKLFPALVGFCLTLPSTTIGNLGNTSRMPKAVKGALLECDPPQMAMVRKIDRESNNAYIIEEIDDQTCLVKETKVEEIKQKVKDLMDSAMGADDDEGEEKDSDLD